MNAAITMLATTPVCIGFGAPFVRPYVAVTSLSRTHPHTLRSPVIQLLASNDADDNYNDGDEVDDDDDALMAAFASLDALGKHMNFHLPTSKIVVGLLLSVFVSSTSK